MTNTEPAFHRVDWQRSPVATARRAATGTTLVIGDRHGLGERLCAALTGRGEPAIRVEPDALTQTLAAMLVCNTKIARIVDLGGYEPPDVLATEVAMEDRAWPELVRLSDLIRSTRGTGRRRSLYAVTSHAVAVQPHEVPVCAVAPVAGFVKSVAQEVPWLRCRHVDLAFGDTGNVAHLLDEFDSATPEVQVAYRDGARFTSRLVPLSPPASSTPPFRPGGLYVMSGGLGEVGVEIAEDLLRQHGVRLLALGRSPQQDRYAAFRRLRAHGEIRYLMADVRDEIRLRVAVQAAEKAWSTPLAGVLHLAGFTGVGAAVEQTGADIAAVLAPKARGAWVLHKVVRDRPGALFVSFSSVAGVFGGVTSSAYAAASAFLDAFAAYQRSCGLTSYSLGWSGWDEQGMGSLLAALRHDHAHQLIGLDHAGPATAGSAAN